MDAKKGLSQRQLCDLMGWNYREVAQKAKQAGVSTHAYVQQQTGWTLYLELYYPPDSLFTQTELRNLEADVLEEL
jgi:hypothetical protein